MRKTLITLSKVTGVLIVLLGLVCAFGGFYFLSIGMSPVDTKAADAEYRYQIMKYISFASAYVMAFGVFNCISGIVTIVNSDTNENNKKCRNYGLAMICMCLVVVVVLLIFGNLMTRLSLLAVSVPLILDGAYLAVVLIRIKRNI